MQFAKFKITAAFCARRDDNMAMGWSDEDDKRVTWVIKASGGLSLCGPYAPWQMRFVWLNRQ